MATNDMLQYLEPAASGGLASASHRRKVETFIAAGTITAGDVVMWSIDGTADSMLNVVISALKALGQPLACGVALNSAVSGEDVRVVISGFATANCTNDTGTIVAGDALVASVVTAGEVEVQVAANIARTFGVALEAADATTAQFVNICVYPQF